MVVWCSDRWSGARTSGLVLGPVVWCSEVIGCSEVVRCSEVVGCSNSGHATRAALRAQQASTLLRRPWGLEGSTASKSLEVVAVCA
jgi:hypothetical protein